MARANGDGPKGRGGTSYSGFNHSRGSEQPMLIVANNDDLADFCNTMHGYIEASLDAQGGTLRVSQTEFLQYCATALKVRVEHVIRSRWRALGYEYTGMMVKEGWALPTPIHDVISSVGEVRVGAGETIVYPIWDKQADELVLSKSQRDEITRNLRSACTSLSISVHDAISKDVEGHHQVMVLTYLPHLEEWWMPQNPIAREDAAAHLVTGLRPVTDVIRGDGGAEFSVVDTQQIANALTQLPTWTPDVYMERRVVVRYLREHANLAG